MFGKDQNKEPTVIVIFGGSGDLNKRKLTPALYNLFIDKYLPEKFAIISVGRTDYSDEDFRNLMQESVNEFSRREVEEEAWKAFESHIFYYAANLKDQASYKEIGVRIESMEEEWQTKSNRLFYLSVAPTLFESIAVHLGRSQVCDDIKRSRIIIEKPFGHDLASARDLNRLLATIFDERQIFRIDHYLGKETVQNILTFRFTNALFEPLWNRNYIDHIQITVAETVGMEGRGSYYESSGALRDMVQNHVLQLLSMIAMEPPISTDADEIRNKKVDVLKAMRKYNPEQVGAYAVRGQYGPGWIKGKEVAGYREEEDVAPDSNTEAYAAIKFYIDSWRWQDVPFYIRTGKRMADKTSVITIQLRPAPHRAFTTIDGETNQEANRIIINIQPEMGMKIRFQAKRPGMNQIVNPVDMIFDYNKAYDAPAPEAYEALLLDAISGNTALFMRGDQVEEAWQVVMPVLEAWKNKPIENYPGYAAGTWGPEEADRLLAKEGHNWINPPASNAQETVIEDRHDESKRGVVNLHVYENIEDLSYCAAELFVRKSHEAIERDGRFVVALSGGSSSKNLYQLLAQRPFSTSVNWSKVYVFWGDERTVPIDNPESNAGMAYQTMLNTLPIPGDQIFPMRGDNRSDIAALEYEELLQDFFRGRSPKFDLILLGLGADAHTASIFPGVRISAKKMTWVKEVFVPKLDSYRISLTPQLINQANCVAFLTYGEEKADALYHVLEGDYKPEKYPAQLIKPEDAEVHWFVDNKAASRLKRQK